MERDGALSLLRDWLAARGWRRQGFRVTVVGPVSLDRIVAADGDVRWRYGGALYPLAAYARLARGTGDRVSFVSHVAPEDAAYLRGVFASDPHVDLGGVGARAGDGTRITLRYRDRVRRQGFQQRAMSPVLPQDVEPYLGSDAFLCLPLAASDLPAATLGYLRRRSGALLLLDAHGPLTRIGPDGARRRAPWDEAAECLPRIDLLKMNRDEARVFFGDLDWPEGYAVAAARLLAAGPRVVWLTQGDQSSVVAFLRNGEAFWSSVPTVTDIGPVEDTTGCGDAAAAGFLFAYLRSGLALLAAAAGNTVGSLKAVHPSGLDLPEPREMRAMVVEHYGDFLAGLVEEFFTRRHVMVHPVPAGSGGGHRGG